MAQQNPPPMRDWVIILLTVVIGLIVIGVVLTGLYFYNVANSA